MRRMLLVLGLMLAAPLAARAEYPDHVVRIIVPVAAGGGVDVMARLLAQKLGERLHEQFVIENRAGRRRNHRLEGRHRRAARRLHVALYAEQPRA